MIDIEHAQIPHGLRIYAIGDVHGCIDQLRALQSRISDDLKTHPVDDYRVIYLGDYVDRGPNSRAVIDALITTTKDPRYIALTGNHDLRFHDFLINPDNAWLFEAYGGAETCTSYGIEADFSTQDHIRIVREQMLKAVPEAHREFLTGLTLSVCFGDYFFCHAGVRPGVPLTEQSKQDLTEIRDEFLNYQGLHPKIIVHGHTSVTAPQLRKNRINVDTGAVFGGQLTCVVLEGQTQRFLSIKYAKSSEI